MELSEIMLEFKTRSGLSWDQVSALLGYTKGQKTYDISCGMKSMSQPSEVGLFNLIRLIVAYNNGGYFDADIEKCLEEITPDSTYNFINHITNNC